MANQKAQTGGKTKNDQKVEAARRPAKERISPFDAQSETKKNPEDEYMEDDLL
ncbi:hypothetical protein A2U01_0071138, partial [Trifolium medium]|nr:hypothetical protein [Trifolium medium]